MSDSFHLGNRKLIPLKNVTKIVPYSRDYVARLAREGKIAAAQVNRQWYIDVESLQNFFEHAQLEVQARTQYVRELRKQELDLHEWWAKFEESQKVRQESRASRSLNKTIVVIILGLFVGLVVTSLAPAARPEVLASLLEEGQLASLISAKEPVPVSRPWYETGEVITEDVSLKNPTGILITPKDGMANPETFFSDEVMIEETSPTTGLIHSSSSSTSVPFVRIRGEGELEEVSSDVTP